jgi:hypothetical protein
MSGFFRWLITDYKITQEADVAFVEFLSETASIEVLGSLISVDSRKTADITGRTATTSAIRQSVTARDGRNDLIEMA